MSGYSQTNDDGHGPATCNYNACKSKSTLPCPFIREHRDDAPDRPKVGEYYGEPIYGNCKHEWRQLVGPTPHRRTVYLFCTRCTDIRTKTY